MTPEERFDKQIEFILKQQAQFYVDLDRLEENLQKTNGVVERNAEQIQQLTNLIMRLGRVVEEQGRQVNRRLERLEDQDRN